jgi:hypothetical protein
MRAGGSDWRGIVLNGADWEHVLVAREWVVVRIPRHVSAVP